MKKQAMLFTHHPDYIPNIENYPLPKIGRQRKIVSVVYNGLPISASVGYSGNRFFRSQDYTKYRNDLSWLIKDKLGGEWDTHRYSFGIRIRFYIKGNRKIDIDNLIKPVLDAATGLIWADDSQVIELYVFKLMEYSESKVEFLIYSIGEWINYFHQCAYCGKDIARKGLTQKYCSLKCRNDARRTATERKCPECGKSFWNGRHPGQKKIVKGQIFCSRLCFSSWMKNNGQEWKEHFKKLGDREQTEIIIEEVSNESRTG